MSSLSLQAFYSPVALKNFKYIKQVEDSRDMFILERNTISRLKARVSPWSHVFGYDVTSTTLYLFPWSVEIGWKPCS